LVLSLVTLSFLKLASIFSLSSEQNETDSLKYTSHACFCFSALGTVRPY
jgi:hypothetical protein